MNDLEALAAKLKSLGAPGDYGYGTPAGNAIFLAHQILAVARASRMTPGATAIAEERRRQIDTEGWSVEHDDDHQDGELALAACCYAFVSQMPDITREDAIQSVEASEFLRENWPWDDEWWKPTTPRRDLVKAGALIAAEIDRRDRIEALAVYRT